MDIKDLIELAKNPTRYEEILTNIETQRQSLQEDIQAFGGVQAIREVRSRLSEERLAAEQRAKEIVKEAQETATKLIEDAQKAAQKYTENLTALGDREDKVVAKEKELRQWEDDLVSQKEAVKASFAEAAAQVEEVEKRNKELQDTLTAIRKFV